MNTKKLKALGLFSLVMITVTSVDSVRNLPATSLFGSQLIFFFLMGAVIFLIPSALVSAELSSTWPKQGGIYVWVKKALGTPTGFLAIWLQWIENVIWYPTLLSFVAGSIGYLIDPTLADNPFFLMAVILACFWGATAVNLFGMQSSAWFTSFCGIAGLFLPMALIIGLGTVWLFGGHELQISFTPTAVWPHLDNVDVWVALTGVMLSFCGIEIATVHAKDVVDPQKNFPKALFYSVAIIISTLMLGSLAIAMVIPASEISLVAGIMQAFDVFFSAYQLRWILPLMALMLVLGGLASLNNWIIGPTKGLLVAAQEGHLPTWFQRENRHGAPTTLLISQAIIVSLLTSVFIFIPSVNGSYWFLTALAAQLYMLMYLLVFISSLFLRYQYPDHERPYRIPGGKRWGMWCVSGLGTLGCLLTIAISFIPPPHVDVGGLVYYEVLLVSGLVVMCLPPFLFYYFTHSEGRAR